MGSQVANANCRQDPLDQHVEQIDDMFASALARQNRRACSLDAHLREESAVPRRSRPQKPERSERTSGFLTK
jgi:hypothetical protein